MVIIVFGLPGTGKSYFASHLAHLLNADYISSDELRRKLISDRTYSPTEKRMIYNVMQAMMAKAIQKGRNVVLDATFYKEELRNEFDQAIASGTEIIYIEITAPEQLVAERLKKPRANSEADFNVYLQVKDQFEPYQKAHLVLASGNNNVGSMLDKAIQYINLFNEGKAN